MAKHRRDRSTTSNSIPSAVASRLPSTASSRASSPWAKRKLFHFFDLPVELRLSILERVLWVQDPVDLNPHNYHTLLPRLSLLFVSRRMYEEAAGVFFSNTFRLFPTHGRFFNTKKPLLGRLSVRCREKISVMEWRVGPGWSKPPRCQNTLPSLGLVDCTKMRTLKIFVEIDPSDDVFNGFRGKNATEDTYKWFCVDLLRGLLIQVPSLETVEMDAWPGIKKHAPLVMALKRTVEEHNRRLVWGPLRGFENEEQQERGLTELGSAMASLGISNEAPMVVGVAA